MPQLTPILEFLSRHKKVVILVATLLLISIILSLFWLVKYISMVNSPKVLDVSPVNQLTGDRQPVIFILDSPASVEEFAVTVSPPIKGTLRALSSIELEFIPEESYTKELVHEFTVKHVSGQRTVYDLVGPRHSSSQDILLENHRLIENRYPLAYMLPYEDDTMRIYYSDVLTLTVLRKQLDADYLAVLIPMLQSTGVVLDSHTIDIR